MDIPQLEITSQKAEFEIRTYNARVEISTRRPQFRLKRDIARFTLDKRLPMIRLDRTAMYNALGIGPVLQAARQYYHDAMQGSIDSIGAISADGTAMMNIQNGGSAIVDLAAQSMNSQLDLNIAALPPPEINWEPGYININWTPGTFNMEWDVSTWADIRVEPHYVEIRMVKYPEVKIRVNYKPHKSGGDYVDKYL